jgi:tetratricopeptide (TPR) repeat protein
MIAPNNPIIHFNLGLAYEKAKNDNEAAKEFQKVLTIRPNDTDAALRLANIYSSMTYAYNLIGDLAKAAKKIPYLKIKVLEKKYEQE